MRGRRSRYAIWAWRRPREAASALFTCARSVVVEAGGCLYQPPGGAHNVVDYTPDLEVLEVTMPADYETIQGDSS